MNSFNGPSRDCFLMYCCDSFLGSFAISLNVETLDKNIPLFWFLCLIIQMLTGDHLDAVSADHSRRTVFDLPFGLAKSLSKEKFGGPNILSAVKTPRDLQLQLAKVIVHTDKHMVDNLYSAFWEILSSASHFKTIIKFDQVIEGLCIAVDKYLNSKS